MTGTPSETTDLKAQYAAQVAADLERNAKEQERLHGEIDALQDQLRSLQQDHIVLVNMQQALGAGTPEPASTAEDAAAPSVPRQQTATTPETGKRTRAKKTTPPQGGKQAKAKKPTAKAEAPKSAQPTLIELIRRHLTEQSEPRSAAEVATALTQAHPDRRIQTNVVRTTLEALVAKSNAQRTRQGSSVYYTAPDAKEPTTTSQTSQADSEPVQANS
ncbi:hypothetical protein [Streptomyces sp. DSM 40750]|uniref:hypothetical protein n=1 Tax=Streptomyces sp. DSM 40750 TaxID=2801030 RepID=UPI00214C39F7|nr:hypothetical protein [Streptomyces sp. DSM 40750]UUU19312.1 hypothetical protein JIX55_02740 [Streptomyces sp. DSM 40750]UUU27345.1 hypothetical protein JIX55_48010 [Streptomyces sp. DSM 40750]